MINFCNKIQNEIVTMRRDLHKIPEIEYELPETTAYVMHKLDEFGIEYDYFEDISGIIGYINRGNGHTVALRSDMDGLRIKEETGLSFASEHDGCMHACGHDAHMAMLLGAAKILSEHRDEFDKEIRLIFQPYEEGVHGATQMIKRGAMDGVEAVFGTHIGTLMGYDIPAGKMVIMPGPNMASSDRFIIKVLGKGCHGSTPEKGIDPITISAHIVLGLEEIIAREFSALDSAVITIGSINGGTQYNAIPSDVTLVGTTRSYDNDVRDKMEVRIGEIASSIAQAFCGSVEYQYIKGTDPVINDAKLTAFAAKCMKNLFGEDSVIEDVRPIMVAEDFAEYQKLAPGVFMQLSTADEAKGTACPHHNSKFDIDEEQLWKGTAAFVELAKEF